MDSAPAAVAPATPDTTSVPQTKLRITASIGMGYIYSASQDGNSSLKKLADDLRAGRDLQISGSVMVNRNIGVGVVYSDFSSSATGSVDGYNSAYQVVQVGLSADCNVDFLGVIASTRTAVSGVGFHGAVALGRTSYENTAKATYNGQSSTATGSGTGLGFFYLVGLEAYLMPRVALAIDVNGLRSTVECSVKGSNENVKNDVSRIGASAGLHFYL